MSQDRKRQAKAAEELEELAPMLPEVIRCLRAGQSDALAYALVYQLRHKLGKVVRPLGVGVPPAYYLNDAEDILESQRQV